MKDPDHVTDPVSSTAPRSDGLPARDTAAPKSDLAPLDLARRIVEADQRDRRRHPRDASRRGRQADRPRGDRGIALGPRGLRVRHRARVHAPGARLLPAREALGGREDDPPRPVGLAGYGEDRYRWVM